MVIRMIIISVPPPPVAARIEALRRPLCQHYHAPWALRYPPHLTLRTGVLVPQDRLASFLADFARHVAAATAAEVITGPPQYGRMTYQGRSNFFLYLPVEPTAELLALNRHLLAYTMYRKSAKTAFAPHVTLLWDDISDNAQSAIRHKVDAHAPELAIQCRWLCRDLELHTFTGDHWQLYKRLPLATHAASTSK